MLRPYQQQAVDAVYRFLREYDHDPAVVLPTAAGKSWCMAQIAKDAVHRWHGRVLLLAHIRELLEQNADKLRRLAPEIPVGIYSAGLRRRDTNASIICAGIQSVYRRACDFEPFDLVIVDECHLIASEDDTMYRRFLADARVVNPRLRVIGFTATPFRLDSGLIYGPDKLFHDVCFEVGIRELIRDGYLCPLISKAGKTRVDTSSLHVRGGEFLADEVETLMDQDQHVEAACTEIVEHTRDRHACLIFAAGVKHGRHIVQILHDKHGVECGLVTGETPKGEREELLERFRRTAGDQLFTNKPLQYLCGINILTTGFDAPNIDCIAVLRPTMSPGLFIQMLGRGFRLHPHKTNCLILDFGGNILRHGPVDQIQAPKSADSGNGPAPAKECPECRSVIAAGYARCPDCGYEFPPPERNKHDARASEAGVLSGQVTTTTYTVSEIFYSVHHKRGADENAPNTMRVEYRIGWHKYQSEWICFEHEGYARRKAEAWWRQRSNAPIPDTADEAVQIAQDDGLADTKKITVRSVAGEPYERIIGYELGDKPEYVATSECAEEIPF